MVSALWLIYIGSACATLNLDEICPDNNPSNCYSKAFEPTEDWQIVKEGQVIPPGLEVKMSLEDGGERYARLPGKQEPTLEPHNNDEAIIVSGQGPEEDDLQSGTSTEGQEFGVSLKFVKDAYHRGDDRDVKGLIQALSALADLASDIEFGQTIAKKSRVFLNLGGLGPRSRHDMVVNADPVPELSTRCLSSALRNNEAALEQFKASSRIDQTEMVGRLVEQSPLLKVRLGLLDALITENSYEEALQGYEARLLNIFAEAADTGIKRRSLNVLRDAENKAPHTTSQGRLALKRGGNEEDEDDNVTFARLAQDTLLQVPDLHADSNAQALLDHLGSVKRSRPGQVKAQTEFLEWINTQVELEKKHPSKVVKRDTSQGYIRHLDYLIDMRHGVFGNRLAARKAYADEL